MEYYTITDICVKLGVSRQVISRLIKKKKIKAVKIGGHYRIEKAWFDNYLENGGDMT